VAEVSILDQYQDAGGWVLSKVEGASSMLDRETPCDTWDVRSLLNHMLETQRYFIGAARGDDVSPPSPTPPDLIDDDKEIVATFERSRSDLIDAFGGAGVIDRTGPTLGIALADQLLHGWDLAKATGQDATMPQGLPDAAYKMIHGRFSDEQRKGVFKPALVASPTASAQDQLLAYTGRDPSS
jgi:uncharacterized protein (TIGR03086 family)